MMLQLEKQMSQPQRPQSDPGFESWLREVDEALLAEAYVTHHDLADQPYRDWYNAGITPHEAAVDTLVNEGFYDFIDL